MTTGEPVSPRFEEESVIGKLLQSSPEFAAFYEAERGKIPFAVHWELDKSLPRGIDGRSTERQPGRHAILLKRIPAVDRDAMLVAHELQHLILIAEDFPRTGATAEHQNLSSSLNSMVQDPIVNARLHTYGFDLLKGYLEEVKKTKRQLKRYKTAPAKDHERMLWIFNYVSKMLDWKVVSAHAQVGEDKFKRWFDRRYPDLAREAQGVLDLVQQIGYDTPDNHRRLFRETIRRYGLARYIVF